MFETMKFEDFKFEFIDVSITGTPDIHITKTGITYTRKLIEKMGYPQFVAPIIDFENKIFGLSECNINHSHAINFSKPKEEQKKALKNSSTTLRRMLRGIMNNKWHDNNRYFITGYWFAEAKTMLFDLNSAKEMPPYCVKKRY